MKRRVHLIHTGGTIGMARGPRGWEPRPGYLAEQMARIPELTDAEMPEVVLHELEPLLDSANMAPEDWTRIAHHVIEHYDAADGFVILHGTDTMAYTASALPFMLHGLRKAVVLTGSQIPLCEVRNDAREHLITSLLLASRPELTEVAVYFDSKLMRGCRTTKVDSFSFSSFESPNFPCLGTVGTRVKLNEELMLPLPPVDEDTQLESAYTKPVASLRLFPGISAEILDLILRPPLRGLVLETYGAGNGPALNQEFLDVLDGSRAKKIAVVAVSQCLRGGVDLGGYATGAALAEVGVVGARDMTKEAALAKMSMMVFTRSTDEVCRIMPVNLRGEISGPLDAEGR